MSDDELDREWKPNGRPQSTMARSFSASLNDVFKIDNSLADLDAAVDQKKKAVLSQTSELEALEARLKATEERLKQRQSMGYTGMPSLGSPGSRRRAPLGETFTSPPEVEEPQQHQYHQQQQQQQRNQTSPLATELRPKTPTRPLTGRREPSYTSSSAPPPMPGALPPTPGTSEGESSSSDGTGGEGVDDDVYGDDDEDEDDEDEDEDDDDNDGNEAAASERASADYVMVTKDGDVLPPVPPPRSAHRPSS